MLPVGNKDDDADRKVVETHDAQRFANQIGVDLFETSAKENINVEEVWQNIALHMYAPVISKIGYVS